MIHFADTRAIIYDPNLAELLTALDLVDPSSPSFTADDPLDEALEIFRRVDVGCLPVVDSSESQQVVGLVEQRDLLRTLHIRRPETADSE